jgi:hypothetical protein
MTYFLTHKPSINSVRLQSRAISDKRLHDVLRRETPSLLARSLCHWVSRGASFGTVREPHIRAGVRLSGNHRWTPYFWSQEVVTDGTKSSAGLAGTARPLVKLDRERSTGNC